MNWRHFFGYASLFIKALLTLDAQFMFVKIHFHNALSSIPYDELNYSLNEPIFSSSKMITRHTHTHTPNFFSWHTHSLAFVKLKASNDNDVQPTKKGKTKGKQYAISEDVQKKKKKHSTQRDPWEKRNPCEIMAMNQTAGNRNIKIVIGKYGKGIDGKII